MCIAVLLNVARLFLSW